MAKNHNNKYISAVKHETLTNKGKIDNLEPLWSHYTSLLDKFMTDMNFNLVKGNSVSAYTKAKPYRDDINTLYDSAIKRRDNKIKNGKDVEPLEDILQEITDYAIQTPLSARYVQACYSQAYETYLSWTAILSDKIKEYLGSSTINDTLIDNHPLLTTCYRINKNHL